MQHNIKEHYMIDISILGDFSKDEIISKYQSEVTISGTGKDFLKEFSNISQEEKEKQYNERMGIFK